MTARQIRRVTPVTTGPALAIGLPPVEEIVPWQTFALCAETDPETFFPEKGESTRSAKQTCRACLVQTECLEDALGREERFGVWGGMSERERRKIRRRPNPGASLGVAS